MTVIVMFDRTEGIRFTHSPSGGGFNTERQTTNPAWDFQFVVPKYEVNEEYGFKGRLVYRPKCSRDEVMKEFRSGRSNGRASPRKRHDVDMSGGSTPLRSPHSLPRPVLRQSRLRVDQDLPDRLPVGRRQVGEVLARLLAAQHVPQPPVDAFLHARGQAVEGRRVDQVTARVLEERVSSGRSREANARVDRTGRASRTPRRNRSYP